jgi:hypothetical protein
MAEGQPASNWEDRGACRSLTDSELSSKFHLGRGQKTTAAKQFCGACPVERECLLSAIANNEVGVWAGTSDKERQQVRKFISSVELAYFARKPVVIDDLLGLSGVGVTVEVSAPFILEDEDADVISIFDLLDEPTEAELASLEDELPFAG